MRTFTVGLAANAAGAHTGELLEGFQRAQDWTGITCDYHWAEDGRNPAIAEVAARTLVAKRVPLVIGHLSAAACLTAARIYHEHNIALVAPATSHPRLNTENWPGIVRVCGSDSQTARAMVDVTDIAASCAILCQDQCFGRSLADCLTDALGERGGQTELFWVHRESDTLPTIPSHVENVFVTGIHEYCAVVVRALRIARPDLRVIVGDDCLTPNFPRLAGRAANEVIVVSPTVPGIDDPSQGYMPTAMVGTIIALQAMKLCPSARGAELGEVIRSGSWPTPYGVFGFDGNGDIVGLEISTFLLKEGIFLRRLTDSITLPLAEPCD